MRRSTRIATALFLIVAACGSEAPSPGLSISFANRALLADAEILAIYFYKDGAQTCGMIRATRPRPPSILGPFLAELGESDRQTGALLPISDIPPDTYVVFVDAQTRVGGNVGSGCTPGQVVVADELSTIQIVISE